MTERTLAVTRHDDGSVLIRIGTSVLGWVEATTPGLGAYQRSIVERALDSKTFNDFVICNDTQVSFTTTSVSIESTKITVDEFDVRDFLKLLLGE